MKTFAGTRPPGPPISRVIRSLFQDPLTYIEEFGRDYPRIAYYRVLGTHVFILTDPGFLETALVAEASKTKKSSDYRQLWPLMGQGVLTSEGELWRRQRLLVTPAFHRERLPAYARVMTELALRKRERWKDGQVMDIHTEMMGLTLQVIAHTLFSTNAESFAAEIGKILNTAMRRYTYLELINILLPLSWMDSVNRFVTPGLEQLDALMTRIIDEHSANGNDHGDLLSILLRAQTEDGGRMSARQVRDEMMTLFFAGHETTAVALSWTWYLLALHPEVTSRLQGELKQVLGARPPDLVDLERLHYTRKVIKESMRLYPPVSAIGREVTEDFKVGEYVIPKGATLVASQWINHRSPQFFDQPLEFQPERWTEEFEAKLPRFAYFPFGGGPRICIGASFAMMEMTLLVAVLAQRFRFELVSGHPVVPLTGNTLRPKYGIRVTARAI